MTGSSRDAAAVTIREALRARGLQQRDLARLLDRSQAAVSDRLRGKTPFTLDELDAIAAFLEVPVAQLLEPPQLLVDDGEVPSDEGEEQP